MFLSYFIVFLILLLLGLVYHRLALQFDIVDMPNHRSSHVQTTVRGGGILIPSAVILWWLTSDFENTWMVLGLLWVSAISMLDDIYTLSSKLRFGVQFLALSMAFYDLGVFDKTDWTTLPLLYFIGLGIINAINFMDGINGITGLYALVFLGSIWAVNEYLPVFNEELVQYVIMAILVFLLFNLRSKALMFAGDIGSISIAYLMIYMLTQWYLAEHSWVIVLFLLIYGVDVVATILNRLKNRENISQPHRSHLYQLFVNQAGHQHVNVALVYALLQLAVNFYFFVFPQNIPSSSTAILTLVFTGISYLAIKMMLSKRLGLKF